MINEMKRFILIFDIIKKGNKKYLEIKRYTKISTVSIYKIINEMIKCNYISETNNIYKMKPKGHRIYNYIKEIVYITENYEDIIKNDKQKKAD